MPAYINLSWLQGGKKKSVWKVINLSKRKYYEFVLIVDKERNGCQESKYTYLIKIKSPYFFLSSKKMFIFRILSVEL